MRIQIPDILDMLFSRGAKSRARAQTGTEQNLGGPASSFFLPLSSKHRKDEQTMHNIIHCDRLPEPGIPSSGSAKSPEGSGFGLSWVLGQNFTS